MLRGSEESQNRTLALIGAVVVLCVVLAIVLVVTNPFGGRSADRISLAIETPYVGQGVESGSAVVLHGVEVGRVSSTALMSNGDVRIETSLQKDPMARLTDSMAIDFRPINYFGVPGINIIPKPGGQALRDGSEISVVPKGNFTLTELLSQLGDVSAGTLTPKLISVIDRVSRYTDGLTPLFETMVIATTAVTDVQTVPTAQLLAHTATISAAFPPFGDALINTAVRVHKFDYYPERKSPPSPASSGPKLYFPYADDVQTPSLSDEPQQYWDATYKPFLDLASTGLFAAVGRLEVSHVDDLRPLVDGLTSVTDVVPSMLRPEKFAASLVELRTRFEKLYGGNGEQRALQVRILLDSFPAVAAPLGIEAPVNPTAEATSTVIDDVPPGSEPVPADGSVAGTPDAPPVQHGDDGSPG